MPGVRDGFCGASGRDTSRDKNLLSRSGRDEGACDKMSRPVTVDIMVARILRHARARIVIYITLVSMCSISNLETGRHATYK